MAVKAELEGWGQRIYEARTAGWRRKTGRPMSQEALAEKVGVKYQTIGQYETESAWPGWSKWMAMAECLDVTVGWLIAGEHPVERGRDYEAPRVRRRGKITKRPPPEGSEGSDEPRQQRA